MVRDGLVPFTCKTHGKVLETFASATVWCGKCNRQAQPPEAVRQAQKRKQDTARRAQRKGPGQSVAV